MSRDQLYTAEEFAEWAGAARTIRARGGGPPRDDRNLGSQCTAMLIGVIL